MMENYFNKLSAIQKKDQLSKCRFMEREEFNKGISTLKGKKIVIVGCGAQGLNQGLNMRDSGLDISYVLREGAIRDKRVSFQNAKKNNFKIGTFEELIPDADLVLNLTPDKNHTNVLKKLMPLMKINSVLSYSHGFNIVEEGFVVRDDISVIMVAPKSPGSEVREEFLRGFGVPTLIAVHPENDPENKGLDYAKAYAVSTGGDRAGVLESSFVAEVKSDLMGEQTILCGVLQTGSILSFDKMIENQVEPGYAAKLIQFGWQTITEALKHGGITNMMDRLNNSAKIEVFKLSVELKEILTPLFEKHMCDILSGEFSKNMMKDWENGDYNLLSWRDQTLETNFEKTSISSKHIFEQEYFDNCIILVAFVKAGVELAFEIMVKHGIIEESAYYESLHETPLIANLIAKNKLYEMNKIISDTAEYGCYLFDQVCRPLLSDFFEKISINHAGKKFELENSTDNKELIRINEIIRNHPVEKVGKKLRTSMTKMQQI